MSTRKGQSANATPKGLSDDDIKRLATFMPDIAHELLPPGTPVHAGDGETRFGHKGSLALRADALWYDHEGGVGGRDGLSLIDHLLAPGSSLDAQAWAKQWLSTHPGTGSLTVENTTDTAAREQRLADYAQRALDEMVAVSGTPAETYLVRERGLTAPWPSGPGYWAAARSSQGEGALVAPLTDQAGKLVAVQLVFLDGRGRKSTVSPAKQIFRLTSQVAAAGACYRIEGDAPDPFSDLPADPTDPEQLHRTTIVCEGIEDALAVHVACPYSDILGMPGIGRLNRLTSQTKGALVVVRDGDQPGSKADQALADGLDTLLLAGAQHIRVTATPLGKDANDILRELGSDALRRLIIEAKPAQLSREGDIKRLARMDVLDVTVAERKAVAKRWDLPIRELNKAITAARNEAAAENVRAEDQEQTGPVWDETVWADPVSDIGEVLDEVLAEARKYVITEEHNLAVLCVWSLHTHLVHRDDLFVEITPRLSIQAEAPDCGKTTTLSVVRGMVQRPKPVLSTTSAAFFRSVSTSKPTVLLDETDKAFRRGQNIDLLQMINGGHSRDFIGVERVEEIDGKREVVTYDVWGAVAMAGIGTLPEATTQSRCIPVKLNRAKKHERPEHMKRGRSVVLEQARQKFGRWAADLKALPNIPLPPDLYNRQGGNWEILLQIASLAGPRWYDLILAAAMADAVSGSPTEGTVIPLLNDIRAVFGAKTRLSTENLCSGLVALADPSGEWGRCNHGGAVSAYYLRTKLLNLLDPPGAQQWKEAGSRGNVRGYLVSQFKDAFERYLDQPQQQLGASAGSSALEDKAQPSLERRNGTDADANPTNSGKLGADSPARDYIAKTRNSSGTSGTKTNDTHDNNELSPKKTVPDGKGSSGTASGTNPPMRDAATVSDVVPDAVPDKLSPSGTKKMKARTASFPVVPDVPDVPDQIREKRKIKARSSRNGLDQSPDYSSQLQAQNRMQGPKEELW